MVPNQGGEVMMSDDESDETNKMSRQNRNWIGTLNSVLGPDLLFSFTKELVRETSVHSLMITIRHIIMYSSLYSIYCIVI